MPTFQKIEYIPTQVLTMRIRNIMKAKEILLQGDRKKGNFKKDIHVEVTKNVPASILLRHDINNWY